MIGVATKEVIRKRHLIKGHSIRRRSRGAGYSWRHTETHGDGSDTRGRF